MRKTWDRVKIFHNSGVRMLVKVSLVSFVIAMIASLATAGVVRTTDVRGHAFLVQQGDCCFAVFPKHLLKSGGKRARRSLRLQSTAPAAEGTASVIFVDDSFDLALGKVEGSLLPSCSQWNLIPNDLRGLLESNTDGQWMNVDPSGGIKRLGLAVSRVTRDRITAQLSQTADARIMKGASGSMMFMRGIPVGMAIQSEEKDSLTLLRMDTIFERLNRDISQRCQKCVPWGGTMICE